MAFENSNKNKTSCSVNGVNIIDPNDGRDFFDSTNNLPIQNEELNISVQLETISKSRTILTNTGVSNQKKLTVSFIDANIIDGKKSLTTNYTLLTTEFDKDNKDKIDENFGITDITIDFDTAYTPMITINFVDVRGSAIFQNDDKLSNNRYRVFFEFPYPIYKLTVKGYFGKPVTYCLHMTTFSSKFNSQTGNFEISAKFIGYTYAMLADMIMGYLATISYTTVGSDLYKSFPDVDTIDEFISEIDSFNNSINNIKSNSTPTKTKKELEEKKLKIVEIEQSIINFGQLSEDSVTTKVSNTLNGFNVIVFDNNNSSQITNKDTYDNNIGKLKTEFNNISPSTINLTESYKASDVTFIDTPISTINDTIIRNIINSKITSTNSTTVSYYDFIDYIKEIDAIKIQIDNKIKESNDGIIEEINKLLVTNRFTPTIGYVSKVFITAIEVFLKSIYRVSQPLEDDSIRNSILKSIFTSPKKNDYGVNTQDKFYPWPAYFEENTNNQFTERYLGDANNIKNNPDNYEKVGELKFIDELLNSIINRQQILNRQNLQIINNEQNWIPVNPADTRLFITESPYLRIGNNLTNQLDQLVLTRAITFLSYSNRNLTDFQIQEMAKAEASLINELASTQSNQKITAFKNQINSDTGIENFIFDTTGTITTNPNTPLQLTRNKNLFVKDSLNAKYDYIKLNNSNDPLLVIPLKTGFSDYTWDVNQLQNEYENDNNIFLTNYSSNKTNSIKNEDGGLYLKILTKESFNDSKKALKTSVDTTNKLTLSKIKDNDIIELNPFGGDYGIQEFNLMDYDDISVNDADLMYVFYRDNEFNSLSEYRDITKITAKTKYDLLVNINIGVDQNSSFTNKTEVNDKYNNLNFTKNRNFLLKNDSIGLSYPFIELVNIYDSTLDNIGSFSLFGSAFYYSQSPPIILSNYSKALLFLSTLPLYDYNKDTNTIKLFPNEILNLFNQKASFIHAPRLWCALVGGILWRNDTSSYTIKNNQIIDGGSGSVDPINWSELSNIKGATLTNPSNLSNNSLRRIDNIITYGFEKPERNEYLSVIRLSLGVNNEKKAKPTNDFDILNNLPEQVKKEFKKIFFDFVNGTGDYKFNWELIKSKLEIFDGNDIDNFKTRIKNIITNGLINDNNDIKYSFITSNFKNTEYYQSFGLNNASYKGLDDKPTVITNTDGVNGRRYFIKLELKGKYGDLINNDKSPVTLIIDGLKEKSIIANNSYRIWPDANPSNQNSINKYDIISFDLEKFKTYFREMYTHIDVQNQTNTALQRVFGSDDLSAIKLKLYKYCKNIYDKWISGAETENVIYRCGNNPNYTKLTDSFRFLSRSFEDISDKFYLDTSDIPNNIRKNTNISFYNFYTGILSNNGFDFIPLPTFINYRDKKDLQDVFKTYPDWYNIPINERNNDNCGPMFICVYGGEKSNALDLGDNSRYPNDGFDFNCDSKNIPSDFGNTSTDNGLAVFKVNYGQQNQNIFTDIQLDQSEFRETDESLKIQESISNSNANIGLTAVGQNLYNIYNVRSYSSKVTMLGNPMIQPMMYYQLNNIPMFKGAYLITNITHDIRPNHMTTTFTGQRIKYSTTPLIDRYGLISNITGVQSNNSNITTTTSSTSTTIPSTDLGFVTPIRTYTKIKRSLEFNNGRPHNGIDLEATTGTDLISIADGEIEFISYDDDGYGLYLIINHGRQNDDNYYKSLYAHLSDINSNIISNVDNINLIQDIKNKIIGKAWGPSTQVKKGDIIGKSGGGSNNITYLGGDKKYPLRGNAEGAHLHFELKRSVKAFNGYINVNDTEILAPESFINSLSSGVSSNNGIIEIGKQTLPPISNSNYNI